MRGTVLLAGSCWRLKALLASFRLLSVHGLVSSLSVSRQSEAVCLTVDAGRWCRCTTYATKQYRANIGYQYAKGFGGKARGKASTSRWSGNYCFAMKHKHIHHSIQYINLLTDSNTLPSREFLRPPASNPDQCAVECAAGIGRLKILSPTLIKTSPALCTAGGPSPVRSGVKRVVDLAEHSPRVQKTHPPKKTNP